MSGMPFISRGATIATIFLLMLFLLGAWTVNEQAKTVNDQQQKITQLIKDQSPLIFAFQNTGVGGRITFVVTCERKENESRYECKTEQTSPVVADLTPVPTPTATPERR